MKLVQKISASKLSWLVLFSVGSYAFSACGPETPDSKDEYDGGEDVLSETGQEVLAGWAECAVSGYAQLAEDADALASVVGDLCSDSDEASLEEAQAAYDSARRTWLGLRAFAIGPEVEAPDRYAPKIDFRPPRYADIEELLNSDEELLPPEQTGAHLRGFPAIEYVLFGLPSGGPSVDSRACTFLGQRAADFAQNASGLSEAWSPDVGNFSSELLAQAGTSTFDSKVQALNTIVNRMAHLLENLRDNDIRAPLGEEFGMVQEDKIVSRVSDRTADDFHDTLTGVEKLFFGTEIAPGISAYAKDFGVDLDEEFREAARDAHEKIDALPSPYVSALVDEPESARALDSSLKELQLVIQIDLMGRLSLPAIFNDADGD